MAQVIFKRQVDFNGVFYAVNKPVKIPDQLLDNWYLKALIKSGEVDLISELSEEIVQPEIAVEPIEIDDSEEIKEESVQVKKRGRPKN